MHNRISYLLILFGFLLIFNIQPIIFSQRVFQSSQIDKKCWHVGKNLSNIHGSVIGCSFKNIGFRAKCKKLLYISHFHVPISTLQLVHPVELLRVPDFQALPECIIAGITILSVSYQQHIPHFAEAFFNVISFILTTSLCNSTNLCNIVFHQYENWPERKHPSQVAWQIGIIGVAEQLFFDRRVKILNPNLRNLVGSSQSPAILPSCTDSVVRFEHTILLPYRNRWFSNRASCRMFRNKALQVHASEPSHVSVAGFLRRRGDRFIANEGDVVASMQKLLKAKVRIISFEQTTLAQQIEALRDVMILVAPHGAGLSNIVFMPQSSVLLEIFPVYWHVPDYFEALAKSCEIKYAKYVSRDVRAAVLNSRCTKLFENGLPENCSSHDCVLCGKQSATFVNISHFESILNSMKFNFE
jgi:hypothetical protein